MFLIALTLLALQDPAAAPAPLSEPTWRAGHLRHVQLLEPRDGVVRFATAVEVGRGELPWPSYESGLVTVHEGKTAKVAAELRLPSPLIRSFSWTTRPTWHLFELGESALLANVDTRDSSLQVRTFPHGDELLRFAGVDEIGDALVHGARGELLFLCGAQVDWLQLPPTGAAQARNTIAHGLEHVGAVAFSRGPLSAGDEGWALGWIEDQLYLRRFGRAGVLDEAPWPVRLDVPPKVRGPVRLAAWRTAEAVYLALADPGYKNAIGRLAFLRFDGALTTVFEGRPDPEVRGDTSDQCEYGQCVDIVPDADEDGVPDVLVTGPWAFVTKVDLLSGATGERLASWTPPVFESAGHSLSLSNDRRRMLTGGTVSRNYPENLIETGRAFLLDVPKLELVRSWSMPRSSD